MRRQIDLETIYNPDSFSGIEREPVPLLGRTRKPFESLASRFGELVDRFSMPQEHARIVASKVENACRKMLMMSKAGTNAVICEEEVMIRQDREFPVLIWDDEIELLYHLEAMILFGRSALDIAVYVFSAFLLKKRIDSFDKFCKLVAGAKDSKLFAIRKVVESKEAVQESWLNILRGRQKGRSLRDKIAHQTVIRIEYDQEIPTSEDLFPHVVVGDKAVPLENFVEEVTNGAVDFCLLVEDVILEELRAS